MPTSHERATPVSTESYKALVEAVVDYAIYMLDRDGRIISWNAGAARIKGYHRDEVLGRHFSCFFTEEDRAAGKPETAIATAIREGRFHSEGWRLRKDGERFWALTALDVVHDEQGRLIGLAKITRDMTEQHALQEALAASERNFRLLVQGVSDYAIYMLDPAGRINSWNSGAERIKGYSSDEVIGSHFSRFFTPEDRAADLPARALATCLAEGRFESEGWRIRKDGSRFWAHAVVEVIRGPDGEHLGFAKVTRDITERRDTQQRLEEAREQLLQAQKLEAIGQLTGNIAHDFNNLLTVVRGAADLAMRLDPDPRVRRQLEVIAQAADTGTGITRQLLTFARRQPLQVRRIAPADALQKTLQLVRQSLRPGIALSSSIPHDLPAIEVDLNQLELALLNLAVNARDAIQDDGEIHLGAAVRVLDGEVDGLRGSFLALSVSDTGCGIPPELEDRIFEPFFTTKQFGRGTGLGLSQVYGFTRESGGGVQIASRTGEGTTVTLFLPCSEAVEAVNPRILVVEDDPALAQVACDMLEMMDYEVLLARSGAEALQLLRHTPHVDLVFSDIVMPGGINGVELANHVRRRLPEVPILLTTGHSAAQQDGALAYPVLDKPYTYEQLQERLREHLVRAPARAPAAAAHGGAG
ncbi:PAS domain S-box protein [Coralloluteibacterium thermophilus]|uniref:histidine kinase n=1 Tax=Coralloluteibacterium thermophilum TaxID=2707049 RepID=A0ABV9NLV7_9GAMM